MRASSHLAEALKKTWDNSLNYSATSRKLNLAISGVIWLTFMTINPFQFRFYARSYWTASGLQASIVEDHAKEFNWPSVLESSAFVFPGSSHQVLLTTIPSCTSLATTTSMSAWTRSRRELPGWSSRHGPKR